MSLELYINGQLADLEPDTRIALTFQVNDIAELKDRQAHFSNKFKLPKTARNRQLLEHADNLNSATRLPYQKISCRLVQDGMELLPEGVLFIDEADEQYGVQVLSGTVNFFERIKGKSIRDLSLSQHTINWNQAMALNARTNTSGSIYAVIDYGGMTNSNRHFPVNETAPAFFIHTLWDKIFEEANVEYECALCNTSFFKNLIIPYGVADTEIQFERTTLSVATYSANEAVNFAGGNTLQTAANGEVVKRFVPLKINGGTQDDLHSGVFFIQYHTGHGDKFDSGSLSYFKAPADGDYEIDFRVTIQNTPIDSIDFIVLSPTSQSIHTNNVALSVPWGAVNPPYTITMQQGQKLLVFLRYDFGQKYAKHLRHDTYFNFKLSVSEFTYNVSRWKPALHLPDIKQLDLIKSLAQMLGFIFQYDSYGNKMVIKQFKDVRDNISSSIDWSHKLDESREAAMTYELPYAQKNSLKYKDDELTAKGYGDSFFRVYDETLDPEKNLFELTFAATEMRTRLQGEYIPYIPALNDGKLTNEYEPRILVLRRRNTTVSVKFKDDVLSTNTTSNIPFCYFIGWSPHLRFDGLIYDHYSSLLQMLTDTKVLTAYFNLTPQDIQELDFFRPVYISKYSEYFYINKVVNYIKGKPTKVELIRL